jgi:hypothetical protein
MGVFVGKDHVEKTWVDEHEGAGCGRSRIAAVVAIRTY